MLMLAAALQPVPDGDYSAGACNIGPAEIARRRRTGHIGVLLSVALLIVLLAIGAPPVARLLIAIPAAMAAVGYLQAYLRFCAAYGLLGVFNFGELGRRQSVADGESLSRDRRRALQIGLGGIAIGIAAGLVAVAL